MTSLADLAGNGRDNNLNLIRALAAVAVLVSHAWPISLGPGAPEPLRDLTGESLGGLAVYVFFVISGFLIASSYARSRTRTRFVVARVLRLFPGLFVSLLLVALLMGPLVTALPVSDYLTDPALPTFLVRNMALILPQYTLPGVFEANPYPTVEGSIWTLFHEVMCYLGVFVLGVAGLLTRRGAMGIVFALYAMLWVAYLAIEPELHPKLEQLWRLSLPFALGTAAWCWADRLPMSLWGVAALVLLAAATRATPAYPVTLVLALGYATLWAAYVPDGPIRAYNRLGDYSYGIYIYAFPAQGLAVWLWGPLTPGQNIVLGLLLTLPPSILSWHLVEKPALALRGTLVARLSASVRSPSEVLPDRRDDVA